MRKLFNALDLFSGCGGLSEGLKQAGFKIIAGVEINEDAIKTYRANHPDTFLFCDDICQIDTGEIKKLLNSEPLHLLAGCPPCQGFSSIRRLNRQCAVKDARNSLIHQYYRFVEKLRPYTIMLENVPGLIDYDDFNEVRKRLTNIGYKNIDIKIVNVSRYGVPQRRKRLIMVGSRIGELKVADGNDHVKTVRDTIGNLESVETTDDPLHKIYAKHSEKILKRIASIKKDGGSLPKGTLNCHKGDQVGFRDVYGRLKWNDVSSTITGGCLNPSKGRFLHPEENRCITAREAALLQTFPPDYIFPKDMTKTSIALMIGNALPPEFCRIQAGNVITHLRENISDG